MRARNLAFAGTTVAAMISLFGGGSATAQRWYGNAQASVSDTRSGDGTYPETGRFSSSTFLNVEDVLFYKNLIRLAGKFEWRYELYNTFHEYRPTYYFDLNGYGYSVNTSYSPYKRRSATLGGTTGTELLDVFYRNWRSALAVNVPSYPALSLAYNRRRFFDRTPDHHYDLAQHTFVSEAGYARELFSLRGNYTRLRRDDRVNPQAADLIQATSGTLSGSTPPWRYANASASYSIYKSETDALVTVDSHSRTHSVSGMVTSSPWRPMALTLSYSGRFTRTTQLAESVNSRAETSSAGLTFSPADYFEAGLVKAYQIEGSGDYNILEYLAVTGSFSRFLRQGVDTRLSVTRTLYQQSNRVVEHRDTLGELISVERLNHYAVDTYYGSAAFSPVPYVDATASVSLTRDAESPQPSRRYQMSSSVDGRFFLRKNLEGRASHSTGYFGAELRLGHAYMENFNAGLSWMPRHNLNLSATYIVSSYSTGLRNRSEHLGLFVNYAYRRAFTLYVSVNQQEQQQSRLLSGVLTESLTVARPRTTNVQLMIYTGRRSTLTLGYLESAGGSTSNASVGTIRTWNATINLQV